MEAEEDEKKTRQRKVAMVAMAVCLSTRDGSKVLKKCVTKEVPLVKVFGCKVEPSLVRVLMFVRFGEDGGTMEDEELRPAKTALESTKILDRGRIYTFFSSLAENMLHSKEAALRGISVASELGLCRPTIFVQAFCDYFCLRLSAQPQDIDKIGEPSLVLLEHSYFLFKAIETLLLCDEGLTKCVEDDGEVAQAALLNVFQNLQIENVLHSLPILYVQHLLRFFTIAKTI